MPTIKTLKQIRQEHQLQYKRKGLFKKPIIKFDISQKIYNSKTWKQLRNSYFAENPLCERCLEKGIIKPAEQVHHVQPFLTGKTYEEKMQLAYDYNNLMSVCKQCHSDIHKELNELKRQNKDKDKYIN